MQVSIVDLRYRMKSVLSAIDRGESVTVLYRGKEKARLVPSPAIDKQAAMKPSEHEAFGIWAGRNDLADPRAFVRKLRQPRMAALLTAKPVRAAKSTSPLKPSRKRTSK